MTGGTGRDSGIDVVVDDVTSMDVIFILETANSKDIY